MLLLVLSSEAMAIFFIGIFPVTRLAMSAGALYSILAFSFSGFTLPVEQMPTAIQSLAIGFPIRHYYLYYVQDVLYGTGFAGWWQEAVHMLLFLFLPLMVMPRLKKAYIYLNFPRN
jgi:ABC-2 type transport system permease protein